MKAYSNPNALIYIPYARVNCLKTIPFTAARTYIAHIWQYLPRGKDVISASTTTKDHDAIGHFRIVQEQKKRLEAERLQFFFLYKQRKMQICPLNLNFVLSKVAYWQINSRFSRRANRKHDRESFRNCNEENCRRYFKIHLDKFLN